MKSSTWLRVASVLTLLLCVGHTLGSPWTPDPGASSLLAAAGMKAARFTVMGFSRNLWDFYQGFGLTITVLLLAVAVLLWQLAALARTEPGRLRSMIAVLCIAFVAVSVLNWVYFFTAPLAFSIAIAVSLGLALRSAWAHAGA